MNIKLKFAGPRAAMKTCCDLEYLLIGDLRQLLDEPLAAHTRQLLLAILDRLLLHLPRQFSLACQQGYMSMVLEECPHWHRQIEQLHDDNLACISSLDELRNRILQDLPFDTIAREVSNKLHLWMQSLATIRELEGQMIQEAYSLDIGGES